MRIKVDIPIKQVKVFKVEDQRIAQVDYRFPEFPDLPTYGVAVDCVLKSDESIDYAATYQAVKAAIAARIPGIKEDYLAAKAFQEAVKDDLQFAVEVA